MKQTRIIFVGLLTLCCLALSGRSAEPERPLMRPVVVVVTSDGTAVQYEIESASVESGQLLDAFGSLVKRDGRKRPVVVVFNDDSVKLLFNLRGIAQKAGFAQVRFYAFSKETVKAVQVDIEHPAQVITDIVPGWTEK
jgi:hypothetical protein